MAIVHSIYTEKLFYLINFTFTFGERCRVGVVTGDKKSLWVVVD